MRLGIMQPYFFPYIGYWQLLNAVDKYVIYDDVNYIKRGWINRNRILINNEVHYWGLELVGSSQNKKICEVDVSIDEKWIEKNIKTLEINYKKAPYFEEAMLIIKKALYEPKDNLSIYLTNIIKDVASYLDIHTEIIISSERKIFQELHGKDRIIAICNSQNATEYINPIGGTELYDKEEFTNNNIQLRFLMTDKNICYKQFNNNFIDNLSIIDVMMFNSKSKIKELLNSYTLL